MGVIKLNWSEREGECNWVKRRKEKGEDVESKKEKNLKNWGVEHKYP